MVLTDGMGDTAERAEAALVGWRVDRLRAALRGPLAVVAAGCTATAARLWALLHRRSGQPAWVLTPDGLAEEGVPPGAGVLVISASGRHHDVLRAARIALDAGAPTHAVVADPDAPLVSLLRARDDRHQVMVLPPPVKRDQVLAVHGLVPLLVVAAQVYGEGGPFAPFFSRAEPAPVPTIRPRLVAALGSGLAGPAAFDFACRTIESGIGAAWSTDARNFAHGGFMPLADRGDEAVVVSFALPAQRAYLDRYFRVFDAGVPVVRVETPFAGTAGALDLLARGLVTFERLLLQHRQPPRIEDLPSWGAAIYFLAR